MHRCPQSKVELHWTDSKGKDLTSRLSRSCLLFIRLACFDDWIIKRTAESVLERPSQYQILRLFGILALCLSVVILRAAPLSVQALCGIYPSHEWQHPPKPRAATLIFVVYCSRLREQPSTVSPAILSSPQAQCSPALLISRQTQRWWINHNTVHMHTLTEKPGGGWFIWLFWRIGILIWLTAQCFIIWFKDQCLPCSSVCVSLFSETVLSKVTERSKYSILLFHSNSWLIMSVLHIVKF